MYRSHSPCHFSSFKSCSYAPVILHTHTHTHFGPVFLSSKSVFSTPHFLPRLPSKKWHWQILALTRKGKNRIYQVESQNWVQNYIPLSRQSWLLPTRADIESVSAGNQFLLSSFPSTLAWCALLCIVDSLRAYFKGKMFYKQRCFSPCRGPSRTGIFSFVI